MDADDRRFMDALLERHVTITDAMIAAMQTESRAMQAEIADQREQIRANTAAVFKVLDRLDETG